MGAACMRHSTHKPKQSKIPPNGCMELIFARKTLRVCPLCESVVICHAKMCSQKKACGNVSRVLRLDSGPSINSKATGHCCNKGLCCKSACTCRAYHQTQIPTIHPCLCKPTTPALTPMSLVSPHFSSQISVNSSSAVRPSRLNTTSKRNAVYLCVSCGQCSPDDYITCDAVRDMNHKSFAFLLFTGQCVNTYLTNKKRNCNFDIL